MHDLAIIIVSTNESHWIRALLPTVFEHIGDIRADVVVVDNDSHDGLADIIATEFPAGADGLVGQPRLWATRTTAAHDLQRALRAVPQPRYRDPRRNASPSWCG